MPDAIISEITVILDRRYTEDEKTNQAVQILKDHGMTVDNVDYSSSVVVGSIDQSKVHGLQHLDPVDYVRTTFTFFADYPPGDSRDLDAARG